MHRGRHEVLRRAARVAQETGAKCVQVSLLLLLLLFLVQAPGPVALAVVTTISAMLSKS